MYTLPPSSLTVRSGNTADRLYLPLSETGLCLDLLRQQVLLRVSGKPTLCRPASQQQLHLLLAQKIAHRLHCFLQNRLRLRAVEFQFLHQPDALLLLFQSQQSNALPCCQSAARAASAFCHLHPIPSLFLYYSTLPVAVGDF